MTKVQKVKDWCKIHAGDLIATGIILGSGIVCYKLIKSLPKGNSIAVSDPVDTTKKILPNLGIGKLDDALQYTDGAVELWLDELKLKDLGKLGEEIKNAVGDLPENEKVWALLDIRQARTE